jgi:hypothetical protein
MGRPFRETKFAEGKSVVSLLVFLPVRLRDDDVEDSLACSL